MHWGALKRMILDRGGFPAFVNNRLMHTKLIWYSNPSPDQLDVANFRPGASSPCLELHQRAIQPILTHLPSAWPTRAEHLRSHLKMPFIEAVRSSCDSSTTDE